MAAVVTKATLLSKIYFTHRKQSWDRQSHEVDTHKYVNMKKNYHQCREGAHSKEYTIKNKQFYYLVQSRPRLTEKLQTHHCSGARQISFTWVFTQHAQSDTGNQWGWEGSRLRERSKLRGKSQSKTRQQISSREMNAQPPPSSHLTCSNLSTSLHPHSLAW